MMLVSNGRRYYEPLFIGKGYTLRMDGEVVTLYMRIYRDLDHPAFKRRVSKALRECGMDATILDWSEGPKQLFDGGLFRCLYVMLDDVSFDDSAVTCEFRPGVIVADC